MKEVKYTLTRSKRKTLALYVRDGALEVRAPLHMKKSDIDSFVNSKSDWINDRLIKTAERQEQRESFSLNYGSKLLYRGKEYEITARDGKYAQFDGESFKLPPGLPPESIKEVCVTLYKKLAKRDLTAKTLHYAEQMGKMPSAVKITSAKTRWGSCSGRSSINYSWRLIMASEAVIDYVVVHELAHLTEFNHSPDFWEIVGRYIPDYKERRGTLKELQQKLSAEDWEI